MSVKDVKDVENFKCPRPTRAMVLTAGFGKRMMPLTASTPKPLLPILGEAMLDRLLDRLADWQIDIAVLNVHYLPDVLREHVQKRLTPKLEISDETDAILETGGGVKRALPLLGNEPFFVLNGDVVWSDGPQSTLSHLWRAFDPDECDVMLLLHPVSRAHGYDGAGDFYLGPNGLPSRRGAESVAPYVFAGVQLIHPRAFGDAPDGAFSLNVIYDHALAHGRLRAVVHDGDWYHVGTPEAIQETERLLTDESMNSY